jgi:GntR family transcriptional regulator
MSIDAPHTVASLTELLRARISAGIYQPGTQLPTEAELGEEFKVGRTLVSRTLAALKVEGIVESRRRAGTWVRERRLIVRNLQDDLRREWKLVDAALPPDLFKAITRTTADVDVTTRYTIEAADDELVDDFGGEEAGITLGDLLLCRRWLYKLDGAVYQVVWSFIRRDFTAHHPDLEDPRNERGGTLRQFHALDIHLTEHVFRLHAINASPEQATLLEVPTGRALMRKQSRSFDTDGRVWVVGRSIASGDDELIEMRVTLP